MILGKMNFLLIANIRKWVFFHEIKCDAVKSFMGFMNMVNIWDTTVQIWVKPNDTSIVQSKFQYIIRLFFHIYRSEDPGIILKICLDIYGIFQA